MSRNPKKITKIGLVVLGVWVLASVGFNIYNSKQVNKKTVHRENKYTHRVAYIDPKNSLSAENFKICDSTYIVDYYNYLRGDSIHSPTKYITNKNGLRIKVLSQYKNKNYSDSGYLNFRFIVNCKGESGAYVIHENDLNLELTKFNPDLVKQLFDITLTLNKWQPNFMDGSTRDSYMYISYKIENGNITEILP